MTERAPFLFERRHAAPALSTLFASGGVLGLTALALPHWEGLNRVGEAIPAVLGLVGAGVIWAGRSWFPWWTYQLFLATGTLLVSYGIWVAGVPAAGATYAGFYVWVALYAALFFSWPAAGLQVAFAGATYAAALRLAGDSQVAGQWLVTMGIVAVSGGVVGWLGRQSQRYYRRLYEGERAIVRQLEEAERVKDDLVAIVSHELRTPLTAIRGFTRTLIVHGDQLPPDERDEFLQHIDSQSARLSRLVENLLLASRASQPDAGVSAPVEPVLRDVVREARASEATPPDIRLTCPPDLVARISADALHQVALNLVANAVKFARPGTPITVAANCSDGWVQIDVRDVGVGIPASQTEDVFNPFVQLGGADGLSGGVGLGLYIVRRLVEAHGGTVEVDADGENVCFTVLLEAAETTQH